MSPSHRAIEQIEYALDAGYELCRVTVRNPLTGDHQILVTCEPTPLEQDARQLLEVVRGLMCGDPRAKAMGQVLLERHRGGECSVEQDCAP